MQNPTVHALPRWPARLCKGGREQVRGPEIFIPKEVFASLKDLANAIGLPIRTVLLAAHCRVMNALTGQSDIITGLVANGRPQCLDGEKLIGLFLNTIPLRVNLSGGTWHDLIKATFENEQELIPNRRCPLSEIQQIAGGKSLFETTFDFVQFHVYRDLPGYKEQSFLEDYYFEANNFNFFTTFMVDAAAAELQMHFDYNPNEFCEEQIALICDYYVNVLKAMAANPNGR
jgi:non-ribosomal peptide synthetase component F